MNGLMEETVQRVGSSLRKKLEDAARRKRPPCPTIFRVPDRIRMFDAKAFEPKLISFGPYHRGKPTLQPMDEVKLHYTSMILRRNPNTVLEDYVAEIKAVELEARSFYSEDTNNIGTDDFVTMMLLDGCFIAELFLKHSNDGQEKNEESKELEEYIETQGWGQVADDMIMLENQIPFLVIQKFFNLAGSYRRNSLVEIAFSFFSTYYKQIIKTDEENRPLKAPPVKVHHLLHLFHYYLNPAGQPVSGIRAGRCKMFLLRWGCCLTRTATDPEDPELLMERVPSATELEQAGVKFRRKKYPPVHQGIFDISFNGRTLEIPQLFLWDDTVMILKNLVAFEQCSREIAGGSYVTVYSAFMDRLIDTPEDVALLHRKRVIVNALGNNENVAVQFNKFCQGLDIDYSELYLEGVLQDLKRHCRSRRNVWRAKLMRDYFSNPWSFLSLLAAFVLLVLTVFQTAYTIQGYYTQNTN